MNTILHLTHIFGCLLSNEIAMQALIPVHLLSIRVLSFCFIVRFNLKYKTKIVLGSFTFDDDINIQCSLYCLSKLCMKKKRL